MCKVLLCWDVLGAGFHDCANSSAEFDFKEYKNAKCKNVFKGQVPFVILNEQGVFATRMFNQHDPAAPHPLIRPSISQRSKALYFYGMLKPLKIHHHPVSFAGLLLFQVI